MDVTDIIVVVLFAGIVGWFTWANIQSRRGARADEGPVGRPAAPPPDAALETPAPTPRAAQPVTRPGPIGRKRPKAARDE